MASYLENATQIAKEAGELLQGYFEARVSFELKGEHDLVTVADRASEKLIVERLTALYPSHAILAEEGGGHSWDVGIPMVCRPSGRHHQLRAWVPGLQRDSGTGACRRTDRRSDR